MFRLRWKTQRPVNPIVRKTFDTREELDEFLSKLAPFMLKRVTVWDEEGNEIDIYTGSGIVR